jgi:hypothetical protein
LRRSVDRVFADSRDSDLADSLRANVSRFAAYKADYVKTTIENILNDASIPAKDKQAYIDANMNAFSAYQATEETTATSRSRTAKQWKEFNDPQRLRLFPNLRWLPSRSIEKRQSHIQFYDHIWSKGDDFWNHNTPGTEWNCKCDVEETDDPVTNNGNMDPVQVPAGLEGNPAVTREIFTDRASYIKKGNKQRVEKFWKPIEEGFDTYRQYRDDANYEDVKMNWDNGGMKATSTGHCMHDKPNERRYFGKTNGELEQACQEEFFKNGDRAILLADNKVDADKNRLPALDLEVNGHLLDIRSITEDNENTIRNGLMAKEDQLNRVYRSTGISADTACLFFYDETMYSEQKIKDGIRDFIIWKPNSRMKHVVCVVRNKGIVGEYDIK